MSRRGGGGSDCVTVRATTRLSWFTIYQSRCMSQISLSTMYGFSTCRREPIASSAAPSCPSSIPSRSNGYGSCSHSCRSTFVRSCSGQVRRETVHTTRPKSVVRMAAGGRRLRVRSPGPPPSLISFACNITSMRAFTKFALLAILLRASSSAEVITNGLAISDARKGMVAAGYKQTGLDMIARNHPMEDLQFWGVDQGVLIVAYSTASQRIVGLTFSLCDERPKATRKSFDLEVASFHTTTGVMTIKMKKGGQDGPANGSQPIRAETNSTSSAAGSRR